MNSVLVDNQSTAIVERILTLAGDETRRLTTLYQLLLGRVPDSEETSQATAFLSEYRQAAINDDKNNSDTKDAPKKISPETRAWRALCRVLLSSTEFVYAE